MYKRFFLILLGALIIVACKNSSPQEFINMFSEHPISSNNLSNIHDDCLAQIEGLQYKDSSLIVLDYYSGKSYTLFDESSGAMIGRFGEIGQGPNEIPLGCYGWLDKSGFYVYDDHIHIIAKYALDSLRANINSSLVRLAKYDIKEAQLSRIIPLNDSLYLGAGTYESKYQYLLFDKNSNVHDFSVEIYNSEEESLNKFHKYLSNQGMLEKHPEDDFFVYSINLSANIDFLKVENGKIKLVKAWHLGNPKYEPLQSDGLNRMLPDKNCVIGYLDICATKNYVYALYSDKLLHNGRKWNDSSSKVVLVFDWNGNPIKRLELPKEAFYIAVREDQMIYTAVKNEEKGWSVECYNIDN